MTTKLKKALLKSGVNETEQMVLFFLLTHGKSRASVIAKKTQLKRPTVYSSLEALQELGLVSKSSSGNTAEFEAAPRERIAGLLTRVAKAKYDEIKGAADIIAMQLDKLPMPPTEQSSRAIFAPLSTLANYDRAVLGILLHESFCAAWDPATAFFRDSWQRDTKAYLDHVASSKKSIREILVEGKEADWYCRQIKNPHHAIKFLPRGESILADIVIGEHSVVFSFNDPQAPGGLQIFHPEVIKLEQALFEALWSRL